MDTTDPDITFDAAGVCSHCHRFDALLARRPSTSERASNLESFLEVARRRGVGREYDCVVGLSGGVDSSFLAWKARQLGLRPLAVHLDNGWNSELAVQNIEHIVRKLDLDLVTVVVDWEEFRDLQLAYFEASVIDIEMITDHAINATLYRTAREHRIPFILNGYNQATEAVMPVAWVHRKPDLRNLKAIHARHGHNRLSTYPMAGSVRLAWWQHISRIRQVNLLDLIDYDKAEAQNVLRDELGWRAYGGKHHESIFTRYYQSVLLPEKFGVDKRRAHLSTLVLEGRLSRAEALAELATPPCDPTIAARDREYVAKKLGLNPETFAELLDRPVQPHSAFASEEAFVGPLRGLRDRWRTRRAGRGGQTPTTASRSASDG